MKVIDKDIVAALNRLIEICGSAMEVERRTGVTNSTISKYRSGRIPRMNSSTWAALEPHLRPFLRKEPEPDEKDRGSAGTWENLSPAVLETVMRIIMSSPELSEAERIKFIRVLLRYSE